MKPPVGFYGWGFPRILDELNKALEKERLMLLESPRRDSGEIVIMGIDTGPGDRTARTFFRFGSDGVAQVLGAIIDDPHNEAHTFDGQFHEINEIAKHLKFDEMPAAQCTVKNRGPQPRTKYPRRR